MRFEKNPTLVREQELPNMHSMSLGLHYVGVKTNQTNYADHFWKPSVDMDEQLSFLAGVEVNVQMSRSFEPS